MGKKHEKGKIQQQQQQQHLSQACPFLRVTCCAMDLCGQPSSGAAQRRRGRRLGAAWRHEQQSIAAALATFTQHSALRGQKTARAAEEGHEDKHDALRRQKAPSSVAGALQLVQRRAWRGAACQLGRASGATGTGPAAHHGAARRRRAHGPDSGHSCATDGGPTGGHALAPRYADSRAGNRSAQDLVVIPLFSHGSQGAADGGAVGGSATGRCREVWVHRADR